MNIQAKPEIYITKRGLPAKRIAYQWTEEKIALAASMWAEGLSGPAIAEIMGTSKGSITAIASKYRDRFHSRLPKGAAADGTYPKVPAEWLEKASDLWMSGKNAHQIALITEVSGTTVYDRIKARPDLFPARNIVVARSARTETRLGDDIVIHHAKRMHITGEIHTMPRVSILNGGEG